LDGANVGSPVTAAPYSYSWDTTKSSNGSHTLKAVAKDAAGTSTTSAGDTVNVNNTVAPPVVSITAPANGATVSGTITVSGTASSSLSISSVQVSVDGGSFSNASGTNTWNFGLDTASLSNATHSLTAKAIDNSGGTASSSVVSISVNNAVGPTVTINWSDVHQQIDGFGASSAATGDGMTDSQADLFWSTTSGVGLSLLRVQIESNGTYPDLATMQKAQDRGVKIWGTPWSPPASMKSNGSTTNGGSLLASDYQAYANYLSSYVLGLKNSYGINLYALSIQNEPDYTATWDSCIWTGQQFHDFLRNNLLPTFSKNGVTAKIIMPEESGWKFDLATATLNDSVTAAGVSIIAGHNYDGASAAPYPLGQNQGKHLWETEVSTFETFDPSMTNGLKWAKKINDWMTIANANAWHYWWLIDGNGDNEALLGPSGQTTKRLYVMGNYSKFVRPGYYRIGTSASPVGGVLVSAYKNTSSGKFAIVAINQNTSAVTLDFVLSGFTANTVVPWVTSASLNLAQQSSITVGGSAFVTTLPAASVTTFVGP
jgi:O-glycosyl hydrolase